MSSTQTYGTPLTARTPGSYLLIFWRDAPQRHPFRGIGAIFEFLLRSRDTVELSIKISSNQGQRIALNSGFKPPYLRS